jgi:hypothetical protein
MEYYFMKHSTAFDFFEKHCDEESEKIIDE